MRMDELEEALAGGPGCPNYDILQRFTRVFGREMTPEERQSFFASLLGILPDRTKIVGRHEW